MTRKVHGHAVHRESEIGAVIEVESAQEVLIGLAVTRVLSDDQAGHTFEQFAAAKERQICEVGLVHGSF